MMNLDLGCQGKNRYTIRIDSIHTFDYVSVNFLIPTGVIWRQ